MLRELLAALKPDDRLYTRTRADTGNLRIVRDGEQVGYIDVLLDRVEWLDDALNDKRAG